MLFHVYALVDMRDNATRYVGQTHNIGSRAEWHWRAPNRSTRAWIRELRAAGSRFQVRVLQVCHTRAEALCVEKHWIRHYGESLLNVCRATRVSVPHSFDPLRALM